MLLPRSARLRRVRFSTCLALTFHFLYTAFGPRGFSLAHWPMPQLGLAGSTLCVRRMSGVSRNGLRCLFHHGKSSVQGTDNVDWSTSSLPLFVTSLLKRIPRRLCDVWVHCRHIGRSQQKHEKDTSRRCLVLLFMVRVGRLRVVSFRAQLSPSALASAMCYRGGKTQWALTTHVGVITVVDRLRPSCQAHGQTQPFSGVNRAAGYSTRRRVSLRRGFTDCSEQSPNNFRCSQETLSPRKLCRRTFAEGTLTANRSRTALHQCVVFVWFLQAFLLCLTVTSLSLG